MCAKRVVRIARTIEQLLVSYINEILSEIIGIISVSKRRVWLRKLSLAHGKHIKLREIWRTIS